MSTPKHSSRKTFMYIFLVLVIMCLKIAADGISQQQESSESNTKTYENSLMMGEETKYNSVEYELKFVTTKMKKKNINLKLIFLEKEIDSSYKLLLDIDKMTIDELGITADCFKDPSNFRIQYWTSVYKKLYSHDSEVFDRIAELFKKVASEEKLSHIDTVDLIISMIQNIKYEVPKLTSAEVLSPALCIDYRYGDCDTKTLLSLVILRKMGVDCVHLDSENYCHAMIGINMPATGEYIEYRGIKYYFLETTYPGWYLGVIPPDVTNKTYWNVLDY